MEHSYVPGKGLAALVTSFIHETYHQGNMGRRTERHPSEGRAAAVTPVQPPKPGRGCRASASDFPELSADKWCFPSSRAPAPAGLLLSSLNRAGWQAHLRVVWLLVGGDPDLGMVWGIHEFPRSPEALPAIKGNCLCPQSSARDPTHSPSPPPSWWPFPHTRYGWPATGLPNF